MWCAFGAHLDVGLAERSTPCRFIGTSPFPSLISGKMAVFDKTESLLGWESKEEERENKMSGREREREGEEKGREREKERSRCVPKTKTTFAMCLIDVVFITPQEIVQKHCWKLYLLKSFWT